MFVVPISLKNANAYIAMYHRHHSPDVGCKFALGIVPQRGEELCGVAVAGRPKSRMLDDGLTLEVTRVCTNGIHNGCSKLYGAMARVAKEMGYRHIITYILHSELGTSLKASGWNKEANSRGGSWSSEKRPRENVEMTLFGPIEKFPMQPKTRWGKIFW